MPKRKYTGIDLEQALSDVNSNKLNPYQASREYNVPRSTIYDHFKGTYSSTKPGPGRMLTEEEETSLVTYIKYVGERGFPISRKMLKSFVTSIIKESGRKSLFNINNGPSDKWCRKFLGRYPELSERSPESQDKARSRMSNWTVMSQYFKLLEKTLAELGIKDRPAQIYNCDETGFSGKEKSKQKVLVCKGTHAYQQTNLTNSHITAHVCIAADGRVLPTYVIFEKNLPHRSFTDGVPTNWLFGSSESGYMDTELFESWFDRIFIPFCGSRRPVLLIFDNHDSHISLPMLKKARQNDIHILGLPPHTTHILQPLDVSIFGPLKEKLSSTATSLSYVNANVQIGKAKFPALLSSSIDHICTIARIKSGFKKCGMYPVNIDAIDSSQVRPVEAKGKEDVSGKGSSEMEIQLLCHNCGTSMEIPKETLAAQNPLVAQGLIPEELGTILVPPPNNLQAPKKKNTKIVTEARVLTGDEMIRQLEEKEETARRNEEEKETRKLERIKRREEKERIDEERKEEAERRKKEREQKKREAEREKERRKVIKDKKRMRKENKTTDLCLMCFHMDPEDALEDEIIEWIQCSKCDGWAHKLCLTVEIDGNNDFICDECFPYFEE